MAEGTLPNLMSTTNLSIRDVPSVREREVLRVHAVDWLLYSTIRKEAPLTSQIDGTQATLTDLFDEASRFSTRTDAGAGQTHLAQVWLPPDLQDVAIQTVLQQAEALSSE